MNKQNKSIEIKQIGIQHVAELQNISVTTYRQTFEGTNNPEDLATFLHHNYHLDKLKREIENPNSFFYFAYLNGNACAYLKLNIMDAQLEAMGDNALELERIYVLEAFQGMKIGQQLLDFAQKKARDFGKNLLWLGVWEYNEAAKAFYKKNNFIPFGKHNFVVGNDIQIDILLKKEL